MAASSQAGTVQQNQQNQAPQSAAAAAQTTQNSQSNLANVVMVSEFDRFKKISLTCTLKSRHRIGSIQSRVKLCGHVYYDNECQFSDEESCL